MPVRNRSESEHSLVPSRALLIAAREPKTSGDDITRSFAELESLLRGFDISVTDRVVQKRAHSTPTYLGGGKLMELSKLTVEKPLVVVDDVITPAQLRNLEAVLDTEVIDRADLILRVFAARASTREAKLQIEIAKLEHELPRIRDDRSRGDREGGGGRGSRGHTNVELAKQRSRERIASLRRELRHLEATGDRARTARHHVAQVAVVGYTNAGKSSWMRVLTGAEVLVADRLFATLGTTVRPLLPATVPAVLIADTIGFIDRLPHTLLAPFRATLSEARHADLLLHVADAADPNVQRHIAVTEATLAEIGAETVPRWLLLNKWDRTTAEARDHLRGLFPAALQLSVFDDGDVATVRASLRQHCLHV